MAELIERKEVLDIIHLHSCDTARIEEGVLNLPIAYNVEKVLEEEEKFLVNYGIPKGTRIHCKIIDIIKGGWSKWGRHTLPTTTEAEIRAKAYQEFYDKVLNFEDYILPYAEENGVQLYSGRDITRMVRQVAEQLKEE